MKQKHLASEIITEEMQQLALAPHSTDSSSNHFDQIEAEVIMDIKEMIQQSENGLFSPTCCIYRVPHTIRHLKQDAYTPKVVSIGPFHYGDVSLFDMETHKQIFFKRFTQEAMTSLNDLVSFVRHLEPKVRASYSENIKLTRKEFVKLMLVDAGFIIELFKGFYEDRVMRNDAKLSQPWLRVAIRMDLLLLENQLPLFFLEDLYDKAFPVNLCDNIQPFLEITYNFFEYFNLQKLKPNSTVKIKHFTDLIRFFHLPRRGPTSTRHSSLEARYHILLYSASDLQEAGVQIKASKSKCLLDLKISRCVLEIPKILVEDKTEILFHNMVALEQCHYPYASYITDYVIMLDCLINTSKAVNILIHKKIMRNYLGDANNVAALVNGLWKNAIIMDFNSEYLDICKRLNKICQSPWHKWKATLRRDYCSTPWQIAISVTGILLLILSIVQTIFSVLQVVSIEKNI